MKLNIIGNAYVATSSITKEQIMLCKKYAPDALTIVDNDGNTVFAINYVDGGTPSVAKFGLTFTGTTRDEAQHLTLTQMLPHGISNAKEYVAEEFGYVMEYMKTLETTIPEKATVLTSLRNDLVASIEEA